MLLEFSALIKISGLNINYSCIVLKMLVSSLNSVYVFYCCLVFVMFVFLCILVAKKQDEHFRYKYCAVVYNVVLSY